VFAGAVEPGALDIAADDVPHFGGIERFADIIVGAETQGFLGCLERAEPGEHDDGKMRVDFADSAEAFDAGDAGHANIHDNGVGLFFLKKFKTGLDAIGRVDLVIGL